MCDAYYVTARSGARVAVLLGPYASETEARGHVERGRALAEAVDAWAHFYAFGTARIDGLRARPVFAEQARHG